MVQKHKNDTIFSNEAKVYSLNNNSWKCVQGIPYYLFYKDFHGVLVNEVLHFIVTKELDFQCQLIACFNLSTESFSYMECTGYDKELMRTERLLSELGGCLCVVVTYHVRDSCIMEEADFWVMNEYGNKESWVRLFSISLPGNIGAYLQIKPLVYSRDGRRVLLEIDSLRLVWYDLESNKVVGCCKAHGLPDGALEMTKFVGSLLSLEVEEKLGQEKGTLPRKNNLKGYSYSLLSV
ncbi:F-box protein CPR30-like [Chenopodium quinoa]|uniref:F-box protein CPR30-like n=1 Tax=Chenopodium quinoa TaxID=63459 RepID=UPI000B792FD6|nr:F-box protein CPR30-like [Chenopodium quinoa]